MKPETDIRVVDYLYDDLPDDEREAFASQLEDDAPSADEARSYAALLSLYRDESEDITPSVAATEKLLAEARHATRPWYARMFGDALPGLLLRPAVGMAAMAVLVVGIGVFAFLSNRGASDSVGSKASKAPTTSSAPGGAVAAADEADRGKGRLEGLATRSKTGAADGESDHDNAVAVAGKRGETATLDGRLDSPHRDKLDERGQSNRVVEKELMKKQKGAGRTGSTFGAGGGGGAANKDQGAALRLRRKSRQAKSPVSGADSTVAPPQAAPAPKPTAMPSKRAPRRSLNIARRGLAQGVGSKAGGKTAAEVRNQVNYKNAPAGTSAPALYNAAQTQLAKGRIAQACQLFGSLVRQHRSYARRADALLGWARCEMSRGAYQRAELLLKRLIKEHPGWRKSGTAWLAEVARQRRRAALRASQRARTRQQRSAPPRRTARPTSK